MCTHVCTRTSTQARLHITYVCRHTHRDFKEWAHVIVDAGMSQICRVGRQTGRVAVCVQRRSLAISLFLELRLQGYSILQLIR